jgi:hypothetical protein
VILFSLSPKRASNVCLYSIHFSLCYRDFWNSGPWPIHLSTKPLNRFRWTFFSVDGRGLSGVRLLLFVYVILPETWFHLITVCSFPCALGIGGFSVWVDYVLWELVNGLSVEILIDFFSITRWIYLIARLLDSPRYYCHDLRIPCSSELALRQYTRMVHLMFYITHNGFGSLLLIMWNLSRA